MKIDSALRVALVDDHRLVRSAIRDELTRSTDVTLVAELSTAEEAATTLPLLRPDVVLVDIDLPMRSGLDLVRDLAPRLPAVWFVMLSADQSDQTIVEAVRAGARGYLSKDMDPGALLRALHGIRDGEAPFNRHATRVIVDRFQSLMRQARTAGVVLPELTERENQILALLADGLTDREIADALVISRRTVESHVANILAKLHVGSRVHAARIYRHRA
jgi:two-component system, NarL family, response regulator DevR